MSFKILSLLLASLGFVLMEENISGARPVQRRYSEATLASDYSRTMDNMLKKNFVEWLLTRRERKSDDIAEPNKREAEPRESVARGQRLALGKQEARDLLEWLLKAGGHQSFPSVEDAEGLKDVLNQDFLTWLMSSDFCRPK
ncbi:GIP protein, partial [Rhinopomastus cyanomelas]|nr:GIP protein [Rhinopomastus cyanomelas]